MLLAEEFALVSIVPEHERPPGGAREYVEIAVRGLLVMELAHAGRLRLDGKRMVVTDDGNDIDDDLLADVVQSVRHYDRKVGKQLRRLDKDLGGAWNRVTDRLARAGYVELIRGKRFGIFPTKRWRPNEPDRDLIVQRLHEAGTGKGPIPDRTAMVLSMIGPAQLLEVVFPKRSERKRASKRIDGALEASDLGPSVKRAIQDMQAAIVAAAAAGAAAATSSN